MINLRETIPPKTYHEDFEWVRGLPKSARTEQNRHWMSLKRKIDEGYFDFSFCFWGNLGRITNPDSKAPGNVFYIRLMDKTHKKVFENFDTSLVNNASAGAPQITSDDLVRIYEKTKQKFYK